MSNKIRSPWALRIISAVILVLIILVSLLPVLPVKVHSSSVAQTEFSAERAMNDLEVVSAEPHPVGSAAQAKVRDFLLTEIKAAGAAAEVQAQNDLANIVVSLPGSSPTGKVLISGHYDSHNGAPGAGDDGVSTVAMLEAIRVLQAGEKLRNDLVFVFFDGEEAGLLGSTAFLRSPLARQISLVVAFDSWPGHGPTTFQQSTPGDEWLARNLAQASPHVYAMSYGVNKERNDFDSDFDALSKAMMGIEFENNGDGTRYHTPNDTVDGVDPSLVQSQGDAMLNLAHHFGSIDLRTAYQGDDFSFFTLPLIGIVAYPYWVNWLVSSAALIIFIVSVVTAYLHGRRIKLVPAIISAVVYPVLVFGLAMIAKVAYEQVLGLHPESGAYQFPVFEGSTWVILGFMLVSWLIFTGLMLLLSRYAGVLSLAVGAMVGWLALAFFLFTPSLFNLGNPLQIDFIAWSLLGAAFAIAAIVFIPHPGVNAAVITLAAIPGIFMFVPIIVLSLLKPVDGAMVSVLLLILLSGLLLPQLMLVMGRKEFQGPANP